jgi:hypothetical protein
MSRPFARLLMACCLALAGGCSVKYGQRPRVEALQSQLRSGVSKKADVLKALGEPRGYGMLRMPRDPHARTLWLYEFMEYSAIFGKNAASMLIVFFEADVYVGHLWFDGEPEVGRH